MKEKLVQIYSKQNTIQKYFAPIVLEYVFDIKKENIQLFFNILNETKKREKVLLSLFLLLKQNFHKIPCFYYR